MNDKDSEIEKLRKSISDLSTFVKHNQSAIESNKMTISNITQKNIKLQKAHIQVIHEKEEIEQSMMQAHLLFNDVRASTEFITKEITNFTKETKERNIDSFVSKLMH